jgi:hypothetical protein
MVRSRSIPSYPLPGETPTLLLSVRKHRPGKAPRVLATIAVDPEQLAAAVAYAIRKLPTRRR